MTTKMQALGLTFTAGVALASLAAPAHAYSIYTSLPAWQAALSSFAITTDPFNATIPSAQSITLASGTISTNSGPAILPNIHNNNSVNVAEVDAYSNAVQAGAGTASNTISWTFPTPMVGFGADISWADLGQLSLSGDFDGMGLQTLLVNDTMGGANGFLGVIGMTPFSSITFGNATTDVDAFSITNAYFAPVPGPLPLLGASAAFGWSRRLRQRLAGQGRRGSLPAPTPNG